ncbi:hypothetical protein [Rickettsia australis]|uniref:Uncharacterized protein n=1 Tax=Rickettsia australis (strain Cutlack) TaxID=1105110 RepID=H8K9Z9_RICAC|nr:hypothetical protein [Rickettsia australis]AFC71709.1 hypothetical protein MC5_07495 [Rickettsia australis str. Cutlack]
MATKILGTATKLANLEQLKKERIAKIEAQLAHQQTQLLQKRKEELFNIFRTCNALTIDDRLLIGFLKFLKNSDNKNHPFLNELKEVHKKSKMPSKPQSGNVKTD